MDACPRPDEVLFAEAAADNSWQAVYYELIDNALDQGARRISATASGRSWAIRDDGRGYDQANDFVSQKHRVGVGFRKAVLWIGGVDSVVSVRSTKDGVTRALSLDWRRWIDNDTWKLEPDQVEPDRKARKGETGTSITVRRVARTLPDGKPFDYLLSHMGFRYSQFLKTGGRITITKDGVAHELQRHEFPPFEETVDVQIKVGRKGARVVVGIVKDGHKNTRPGFSYICRGRVIVGPTARGCGRYSSARIVGDVVLDDGWDLTTFKDGGSNLEEELYEAVFAACNDLLNRAKSYAQGDDSPGFAAKVSAEVSAALGFVPPGAEEDGE